MRKIGIVVIATNAYFALGVKFLKQFIFFSGHDKVTFYFFSDTDPAPYLPNDLRLNVKYVPEHHKRWGDGTNSKFKNILTMEDEDLDYIYYFDADTSVSRPFTTDWFIGELVGANTLETERGCVIRKHLTETQDLNHTYHTIRRYNKCITMGRSLVEKKIEF